MGAIILAFGAVGIVLAQTQLPGTALTSDPGQDLRPVWSPDETQILFFSNQSGNNDIWVMDDDGGNKRQLTTDPADDRRPAWSPDSRYIAFDSDRSGQRDIWVMDADGAQVRQLTSAATNDSFPAWSPDGKQIAFYSYSNGVLDLFVVAVESFLQGGEPGTPRQITDRLADQSRNQCTFACHMPAWSPDGSQLAYAGMNNSQIWVIGLDGSNPHPVTDETMQAQFPQWMSDNEILFLVEHLDDHYQPVNDVWVTNANGSETSLLFADIPHGGPLEFKADRMTVAFHSPRAGDFNIYTTVLGQPTVSSSAAESAAPESNAGSHASQPAASTDSTTRLDDQREAAESIGQAVTPEAPAIVEPELAPETTLPVAAASAGTDRRGPGVIWGLAVLIALGVLLTVYLARRNRPS